MPEIAAEELTGQTERHLVPCWSGGLVHRQALGPLQQLREMARAAGFELAIASSFRSYERQLLIWRQKVAGERQLISAAGAVLDPSQLTDALKLEAILRWSALPGLSRHHWGTDFDVYDAAAVNANYRLQLTEAEYGSHGPFAAFSRWLGERIARGECGGFFRPYDRDRGGVAPEPWHISYRPVADTYAAGLDFQLFERLLQSGDWPLSAEIGCRAEEIFQRYVLNGQ
ncbi:MAG: M15 family metallopeptidase [Gammaproteobacteria bacterium]|uniref:M15 family metallopeptidase n=1 Tax=Pseudomaricurvus alcaniphilus TaxID=1166482 RepID=UPI00140D6BE1|nr:M15 family metallopeptidase [Pseudomaricurvus alcaniphilus]MBR9909537.1 M15 family metallopeptidase [Gammaproteobacteria bacterium]NHN37048.1 M15 family metallopeptidase [Pseudomaricurvus alcaniphilus]